MEKHQWLWRKFWNKVCHFSRQHIDYSNLWVSCLVRTLAFHQGVPGSNLIAAQKSDKFISALGILQQWLPYLASYWDTSISFNLWLTVWLENLLNLIWSKYSRNLILPGGPSFSLLRHINKQAGAIWIDWYSQGRTCSIESVQDFLITSDIKPCMHLVEISILSCNHVIVRLTKIMNRLLEHLKICTFKFIFLC